MGITKVPIYINGNNKECIDVILVALAMFYKLSENDKELHQLISKKLNKWESKIS